MIKLTHLLSGGLSEAKRCLNARFGIFNELSRILAITGVVWLTIGSTLHYLKHKREEELRVRNMQPKPA